MKTLRTTIAALMIMITSIAANAQPMSVYSMRNNARFLTDRMAYTLGLSAAILDELYYINYDYICGVNDYLDDVALGYRYDDYMAVVYARDRALRRLLTERQWTLLMSYDYFYRPISFVNHRWSFGIYRIDKRLNHFFFHEPRRFNDYRGGTIFAGMRRNDGPMGPGRPAGPAGGMNRPGGPQGNGFHIGDAKPGNNAGRDMRGEAIRQSGTMNSTLHQNGTENRTQNATRPNTPVTNNNTPAMNNGNRTSATAGRNTTTSRSTVGNGANNSTRSVGNSGMRESSTRTSGSRGTATAGRR